MQRRTALQLLLACLLGALPVAGCSAGTERTAAPETVPLHESGLRERTPDGEAMVRHATGFTVVPIDQGNNAWLVTVKRPWQGARFALVYALVPRDADAQSQAEIRAQLPADAAVIETPVRSIATFSASFLTPLELLGATGSWVGHDQPSRVYSEWAQQRVEAGQVARLGDRTDVDIERLLALQPDVVMLNEYEPEGPVFARLSAAGLSVLVSGDWLETTALGRAEWIKLFGLLYGRRDEASEYFSRIERDYLQLRSLAASAGERPVVLSNAPYGGVWSVPAGESYSARLFSDAGGDYLWAHTSGTGALHLDLEQVFLQARDAHVWMNPGAWRTLDDGRRQDPRLSAFNAYRSGDVYNFDRRTAAGGGNDFFESGPYRPHVVLADLVRIFHPDLLPDHRLYYYRRVPP